ncbi:activating signal cointegrator 1 complex subunit 3 [Tribolium castaneum]|uniref:U5 small nuclear ribonucleoprotein 200 kDa helicase-like protein n=1 Tax=Tribolium castaneum TaxID=7070 RepID=A0A139WGF9_TRICA|nr:PREDICTED: activating signal cointegrator 1 complex subunit 3 [Tribolium castaneum]KYB27053.1 Putative U5 small nuclear ribonucleoprotein 200 kDa helicase-like protein [Tribolium castaneum]|eukprot:XP_015836282.1 PREDICTED: activating signal cointegrator 1 complex subunit 3 [Tribolium castaneum]
MVIVEGFSPTRNFFSDFHGLQRLNVPPSRPDLPAKQRLARLYRYFKYEAPGPGLRCVVYLERVKRVFRAHLREVVSEVMLEDVVTMCLLQALKDYERDKSEVRGVLRKLPQRQLKTVKDELEYVCDNLPGDFFKKGSEMARLIKSDVEKPAEKPLDIIFYIPMSENEPCIEGEVEELSLAAAASTGAPYCVKKRYDYYKSKMAEFPFEEFKEIIITGITSQKSNEELLNYFLDVFGCEVFEFLNEIIQHRSAQIEWGDGEKPAPTQRRLEPKVNRYTPALASQVIVQSEEEKNLAKTLRKIERKQKGGPQPDFLNELEGDLNYIKHQPIFRKGPQTVDYPHVHDQLRNISITTKFNGVTLKQPENTVKKETSTHVEFTLPGGKRPKNDDIDLVKVTSLDPTGRLVFKDIKEFNRIQSEVFPVAYNTNENMLICAPTGAGKTNIALLAIVHQIKAHMEGGLIRKDDFKIVYVCPMKALATEMVSNFSKKLAPVGIVVKELTGDMQLTKKEIAETQMLVTTPEKWDVISRKGAVDTEVTSLVKLLILDEVHLLNSDRGPVIEALVARTLRQVLSSQSIIRIVALSATLPGYLDVANFLKVNPNTGLFFFDNRFRSVPLTMTFIGVKNKNDQDAMDLICYNKIIPIIKDGQQVMVFVTSRNLTAVVAKNLLTHAKNNNVLANFIPDKKHRIGKNFKSSELELLVPNGFGVHHAGMCRSDRLEVESLFRVGALKVIVCTTTLAWGVNLPAHAVIIRGTTRYDAQKSSYVDMDMLDIQQIFGRAGRPQYDTSGHGMIITSVQNMANYMSLLTSQAPIESQFLNNVPDHLNAEIVLGTVSNLKEAMEWLTNTFVYCRIKKNPLVYGLTFTEIWEPEKLFQYLERKLFDAASTLESAQMVRFNPTLGELRPTNYGRIASFYYISHQTMKYFHDHFERSMVEADILHLISNASEFQHIQVRNDELDELDRLHEEFSQFEFNLDPSAVVFKVLVLIQANISRAKIRVSSLVSDCEFIMQSVTRLARALFEIAVDKNYALQVWRCLEVARMVEQQAWTDRHPLMQFKELEIKGHRALDVLHNIPIEELQEMTEREILDLVRSRHLASRVHHFCKAFPRVNLDVSVKPITEGVIRLQLLIGANFSWDSSIHGNVQHYYAWVEDPTHDSIYHFESFIITKKQVISKEPIELIFTVPLQKPHSNEYFVTVVNSKYMAAETSYRIDLDKLHLLPSYSIQTKFLSVRPLPKTALHNTEFENLYSFTHFNAVQSQVFHCCFNTDSNVLLGAPTGSGKTIVSEICILRLFANRPERKVVYIAPMKALVRERVLDWTPKFAKIGKKVVEVTGDVTPHSSLISTSHIIITTPEKWDGMSRNWLQKDFVKQVGLIIIDEIHLLAEDRGPVLEVIVSRMNYINSIKNAKVRIVGLSTAMANAGDLANWLNIEKKGLYNFSSSVRPVPLEIHLKGFSAKNYCPRMATMNRPAYQAICQYAPESPTLIFVSSRKQTRITSYDLIKCLLSDTNPKQWLHCQQDEIEQVRKTITDSDLSYLLLFGIGIHHAGLQDHDRKTVEELFVTQKIQVLVATATLAWGVNFPAHLVIVKGTEYYDGATKRYVDMPVTDVLQMMGRAGRPQFDTSGVACVFVQESKKNFYRKFLFEPFPVESNLLQVLPEHVNAEIANGTVTCRSQLVDLICSTFFFRRLLVNPSYYKMEGGDANQFLNELADSVAGQLQETQCIVIRDEDVQDFYESTFLGQIAAQYYLSCKTVLNLDQNMSRDSSFDDLLAHMCHVEEYALFPVRHNEDKINRHLTLDLNVKTRQPFDSPHLKVLLLIKCYLSDKKLPNQEYVVDLKTVFDQVIRIMQAMISLTSHKGWLDCTLKLIYLGQMLIQGLMIDVGSVMMLPHVTPETRDRLSRHLAVANIRVPHLKSLLRQDRKSTTRLLDEHFGEKSNEILKILARLPTLEIKFTVKNGETNGNIDYRLGDNIVTFEAKARTTCLFEFEVLRDGTNNLSVYSRKFSKQKDESWFFVMAFEDDLVRLQRFAIKKSKSLEVEVQVPGERGVYEYAGYFMSDSYIGLDQKVTFKVTVVD